jgi:hypothetical protein
MQIFIHDESASFIHSKRISLKNLQHNNYVLSQWMFNFRRKLLPNNLVVSLLSCDAKSLNIFLACSQMTGRAGFGFAVVASNCNGILHRKKGVESLTRQRQSRRCGITKS